MSLALIRKLPCWQGEITAEPLNGGLSNESWKVTDEAGAHVVRFGTDYPFHHVDRRREVVAARAAHAAGFAPEVEYSDEGVMVSTFLDARTWAESDLAQSPDRVAKMLRDFHTQMPRYVTGPGFAFWVFHVIRDYARTLQEGNSRLAARLPGFLSLAEQLEDVQVPLPIVFGHHDLLPANFLDDGERLWLIDFEYAGFGTAMFDLAGAASNSGMSEEQALALLAGYFNKAPDDATLRAFDAMRCASLLREAMWAMVSEIHLNAPGVDYAAYAQENLTRLQSAIEQYQHKHGKLAR